jgi:acyl-CoA dehydrogenase
MTNSRWRSLQTCRSRGYSKDTVLEWIYRYTRQARLVDGADKVHRMVLNRLLTAEGPSFWNCPVQET